MHPLTRLHHGEEAGFSLVELLVVMAITTIVGLAAVSGMSSAVRATTQTQRRIDALTELQRSVARLSREARAARPLCAASSATRLVGVVDRGSQRLRYTYELSTTGSITSLRETVDTVSGTGAASCTAPVTATRQVTAATNVVNAAMFTYYTGTGAVTTDATQAVEVAVTLQRPIQGQRPLVVTSRLTVRNWGLPG